VAKKANGIMECIKKHGQQVKGGYSSPPLCPGEAPPGVLCPVLGSLVEKRQGSPGKSPAEGHKGIKGPGGELFFFVDLNFPVLSLLENRECAELS